MSSNALDRVISALAPGWGAKRAQARALEERYRYIQGNYDAANPSRRNPRRESRGSADTVVGASKDSLRSQARYLDENHDLAKGVLDVLVGNVIGRGIQIDPQVRDRDGNLLDDYNQKLRQLWEKFERAPDVTGELDLNEAWRLNLRTIFRDGEAFVQMVQGNAPGLVHASEVPFSLEFFEPDFVPHELYDFSGNIVQGVEKNGWGRARAYYAYRTHPGNRFSINTASTMNPQAYRRLPADRVLHQKIVYRLHQTRGVSIFAPVLQRLSDIQEYEESERVAARVAAALTGYIKKEGGGNVPTPSNDDEPRDFSLEPGMIFDTLRPGEEVGTIKHERPNSQLWNFRKSQLQAISSGTGASYSSSARDYDGSYSSQRQELVEQWNQTYLPLRAWFIAHGPRPVWERFVEVALAAGVIRPPRDADRNTLYNADFRGPAMPWIDPSSEVEASLIATKAGFTSRRQVIRERGDSPSDINREIRRERKEAQDAGLVFDSDPGSKQEGQ